MVLQNRKSQLFCLGILAVAYYYRSTFSQHVEDGPLINTRVGKVQGTTGYSRGGRKFFGYKGIPYALPPVGNRRFEPPEPVVKKWEGVREGREFGPKCIQLDLMMGVLTGDEDCLTLNVFTPVEAKLTRKRLPVLVYFHGGFFHNGGSDFWQPNYFMDEDVIFVTLNFRLAALGFLNTGDGLIRGNMGLKDQTMGLRWIQENIEFFGGDPDRVTLLGESAGAVCSHLHMFSPMSRGLFNNAISQSGSALHFWAINSNPKEQAERFAQLAGCDNTNGTKDMVKCLKQLDAGILADVHKELLDPLRDSIAIFKPSLEVEMHDGNTFLAEHPQEMVKRGDYAKVPWVTGVNSEEGLIISAAMLVNKTVITIAQEDWKHFLLRIIWYPAEGNTGEKIRKFYFGNKKPIETENINFTTTTQGNVPELQPQSIEEINMDPLAGDTFSRYTNMISDRGFFYDTHHGVKVQSVHSPVYLYYYSYKGEFSVVNFFPEVKGILSRQLEVTWSLLSMWVSKNVFGRELPKYGTSHSDELAMLFYMPWISEIYQENQDFQMSIDLVKLWVEFAQDDSKLRFRNVEWPTVTNASLSGERQLQYMRIDDDPKLIDEPFSQRIEFWNTLSPE